MNCLPTGALRRLRAAGLAAVLIPSLVAGGCSPRAGAPAHVTRSWVAGCVAPGFDPGGPPHPVRAAIERLLSHGLFVADSSGRAQPAPGVRSTTSADGRTWTFRIDPGLRFVDDSHCSSADFRAALEHGLARTDHSTGLWLLGSLEGADRVRPGRPLPRLGIETPDATTLILQLRHADPRLAEKLAAPGLGVVWRQGASAGPRWEGAVGLGPYRVARQDSTRKLVLVRSGPGGADSILVRFLPAAGRTLAFLRAGAADLVWPVPLGIGPVALPAPYRWVVRPARPPRRLLLVMRADLPPTSKLPTRAALVQSLNPDELMRGLGDRAVAPGPWVEGGPRYEAPSLDEAAVRQWMDLAKLGRSFHVRMAYDADGTAAAVARAMQGQWARLGIDVELIPLRGEALTHQLLSGDAQLLLVEEQPRLRGGGAVIADLVLPLRGPAVGAFRTGWRTREFDAWLDPRDGVAPDADALARRLADERIVVPLADLPWSWIERSANPAAFDPRLGPECAGPRPEAAPRR